MPKRPASTVPSEIIEKKIYLIRGHKIMLDSDLAKLYEVEVKALNQAVKRNLQRFPADFMFQLSTEEAKALRSQFVTLKSGRGQHRKFLPYAFIEQGVAMLSSVLKSARAVQVNVAIMRTFVKIRALVGTHADVMRRLDDLEKKYDERFRVVFEAIRQLMEPAPVPPSRRIGFNVDEAN